MMTSRRSPLSCYEALLYVGGEYLPVIFVLLLIKKGSFPGLIADLTSANYAKEDYIGQQGKKHVYLAAKTVFDLPSLFVRLSLSLLIRGLGCDPIIVRPMDEVLPAHDWNLASLMVEG